MWCSPGVNPWTSFILIHVNDIAGTINHKLLLYADDSAILVADKNIPTIGSLLQNELEVISEWLVDNKLSLHLAIWEKQNPFCLVLNVD